MYLIQVQERFEVDIKELPEQIDTSTYSKYCIFESLTSIHGTEMCSELTCCIVALNLQCHLDDRGELLYV